MEKCQTMEMFITTSPRHHFAKRDELGLMIANSDRPFSKTPFFGFVPHQDMRVILRNGMNQASELHFDIPLSQTPFPY